MARRKRQSRVDERVAARVRDLRKAQGLSQAETARRAGFARSHLSQIESGNTVPSIVAVEKLAQVLGVSMAELVGETGPTPRPDSADALARELRERGPVFVRAVKTYLKTLDQVARQARESD